MEFTIGLHPLRMPVLPLESFCLLCRPSKSWVGLSSARYLHSSLKHFILLLISLLSHCCRANFLVVSMPFNARTQSLGSSLCTISLCCMEICIYRPSFLTNIEAFNRLLICLMDCRGHQRQSHRCHLDCGLSLPAGTVDLVCLRVPRQGPLEPSNMSLQASNMYIVFGYLGYLIMALRWLDFGQMLSDSSYVQAM